MSVLVDIAEAVKTVLNAASLSQSFTAERAYIPVYDTRTLVDLKISVIAASDESERLSRASNLCTYRVDIGVQKRIGTGTMTEAEIRAACDPLMTLAEEIGDLFDGEPLTGYTSAKCTETSLRVLYVPQMLDTHRVFTSVVTLTFQVVR
jgi:hypothetical protein